MRAPKGWCEPAIPINNFTTISTPINIPTSDSVDESKVPLFLRDDLDLPRLLEDKDWNS